MMIRFALMPKAIPLLALLIVISCPALGAEITGIWMGQAPGRGSEKQDVAFQFNNLNGRLTGVMFGDEFDLPVEDLKIDGDKISFSVTTTNYYSGNRATTRYTGTVSLREMQLTRERPDPPAKDSKNDAQQIMTLTRVPPSSKTP